MESSWVSYDPTWLVELARRELPNNKAIQDALAQCTRCRHESDMYIRFVDPRNPNQPGSEWQFKINNIMIHPTEGALVLDVLKDGRVGGVEFLDRVMARYLRARS